MACFMSIVFIHKTKMKSWDSLCFQNYEAVSRWYNQGHFLHFLQSASCKDYWDHSEKENLIFLMENENPRSIYETWRGSGYSLHDMETYMGQRPKTLSLLSIMLHTGKGQRHARDSLYWIQMSPKEQVHSVKLPQQHQLLMKSWGERSEEGYMFRHIFTIILQTSLFPKKNKMKAACL